MQIDLKKIALLLLRRWYVLLAAVFLGGIIAVFVYMSSTPKFQVTASLMLRPQDDNARPTDDMMRVMGFSGPDNVQDEVEVLSSRRIYSEAIRDLGLQVNQRRKVRFRWIGVSISPVYSPVNTISAFLFNISQCFLASGFFSSHS